MRKCYAELTIFIVLTSHCLFSRCLSLVPSRHKDKGFSLQFKIPSQNPEKLYKCWQTLLYLHRVKIEHEILSRKIFKTVPEQTFFLNVETCVFLAAIRATWMIRKKLWQVPRRSVKVRGTVKGWLKWVVQQGSNGPQWLSGTSEHLVLSAVGSSRSLLVTKIAPSAQETCVLEDEGRTKRSLREKTSWAGVRWKSRNKLPAEEMDGINSLTFRAEKCWYLLLDHGDPRQI